MRNVSILLKLNSVLIICCFRLGIYLSSVLDSWWLLLQCMFRVSFAASREVINLSPCALVCIINDNTNQKWNYENYKLNYLPASSAAFLVSFENKGNKSNITMCCVWILEVTAFDSQSALCPRENSAVHKHGK